jgi:hypothetical protein
MLVNLKGFLNSPLKEFLEENDFSIRTYNTICKVVALHLKANGSAEFNSRAKVGHLFCLTEMEFRSNYGVSDRVIKELNDALSNRGVILF